MIAALSLFSILAGAILARCAAYVSSHNEAVETGAGVLLIAGTALIGIMLPHV